ncbi:MAG: hypothetical protein ACRESF_29470, partial [Pseudomonas sp.]
SWNRPRNSGERRRRRGRASGNWLDIDAPEKRQAKNLWGESLCLVHRRAQTPSAEQFIAGLVTIALI